MEAHQLINQDSGDTEYYTPLKIVCAARNTMGGIDLDPASSEVANRLIDADMFFTKTDNSLERPWFGRVWMNHPFSKGEEVCDPPEKCVRKTCRDRGYHCTERIPSNREWIQKLLLDYEIKRIAQFCCITFASTSEDWFGPLHMFPQCYLAPRTNYYRADGTKVKGVSKGSVVTYGGPNVNAFIQAFWELGYLKLPVKAKP